MNVYKYFYGLSDKQATAFAPRVFYSLFFLHMTQHVTPAPIKYMVNSTVGMEGRIKRAYGTIFFRKKLEFWARSNEGKGKLIFISNLND